MKISELGRIKHQNKKRGEQGEGKPSKADREKIKQLRKFKRNN